MSDNLDLASVRAELDALERVYAEAWGADPDSGLRVPAARAREQA